MCGDVSKTDDGLAAGVTVIRELVFLIELQGDLALIGRKIEKRRAALSACDPVIGPGFTAEESRSLTARSAPVLFEPGLVFALHFCRFQLLFEIRITPAGREEQTTSQDQQPSSHHGGPPV